MALGGDMSDKVSLKKLNCSWYYNWATDAQFLQYHRQPNTLALHQDKLCMYSLPQNCWATDAFNNSIDEGVDHIPMMWGGADDNKEGMAIMQTNCIYIIIHTINPCFCFIIHIVRI